MLTVGLQFSISTCSLTHDLELCLDILDAIADGSLHDVCFISNVLRAYSICRCHLRKYLTLLCYSLLNESREPFVRDTIT